MSMSLKWFEPLPEQIAQPSAVPRRSRLKIRIQSKLLFIWKSESPLVPPQVMMGRGLLAP